MSRDNLGNKQTIILHNCKINHEKYDLVTLKKIINKRKQISRKRFSKRRNAVSESKTSAIQELYNLKDSISKNHQNNNQIYFSDPETTSPASIKGQRTIKKVILKQTKRSVQLESTNKTH